MVLPFYTLNLSFRLTSPFETFSLPSMENNIQPKIEKYIRLLEIIFFVLGIAGTLYGIFVITAFKTDILDAEQFQKLVERFEIREVHALLNIFFYLPLIPAAIGVHKRKRWGRNIGFVWSVLYLSYFPMGTIIALFSLWVLFKKETKEIFKVPKSSIL